MSQAPVPHCDCCGLPIAREAGEDCPRCQYPIALQKEQRFLAASIRDLQRVAEHGGAQLSVADLLRRYKLRFDYLRSIQAQAAAAPTAQAFVNEPRVTVPIVAMPALPGASIHNQANAGRRYRLCSSQRRQCGGQSGSSRSGRFSLIRRSTLLRHWAHLSV